MIISLRSLQEVTVNWVRELYTVSEETLAIADSGRRCWICGGAFAVGDGMTVAGTDQGNKLMHSRCYELQAADC